MYFQNHFVETVLSLRHANDPNSTVFEEVQRPSGFWDYMIFSFAAGPLHNNTLPSPPATHTHTLHPPPPTVQAQTTAGHACVAALFADGQPRTARL